jgi:hypothetical protein
VRSAVLVLSLALAAAGAPEAGSDIGLITLSRANGRPGIEIVVTAGGYGNPWPRMPIYLVPAGRAPQPYPCANGLCDPRALTPPAGKPYIPLGRLHYHADFRATLRFRVPQVPAGGYRFVIFCEPCYRGPWGSLITTGPGFRVTN